MTTQSKKTKTIEEKKLAVIENIATVFATAICVGAVAFATDGSLHCLWGLTILVNINTYE